MNTAERGANMGLTWFCVWDASSPAVVHPHQVEELLALLRGCPGLRAGHVMTPAEAHDPYYPQPSGSPALVVQIDMEDVATLEAQLRPGGHLAPLADADFLPGLRGARVTQQAMLQRRYDVPSPRAPSIADTAFSYWVEYTGPAQDANAWHAHYMGGHPQLMAQLPGIRAIEIYTPAVSVCELPIAERGCLQRNRSLFDSPQALSAAMLTPVREALREHFRRLPPFAGESRHFPFATFSITLANGVAF